MEGERDLPLTSEREKGVLGKGILEELNKEQSEMFALQKLLLFYFLTKSLPSHLSPVYLLHFKIALKS